mgnify:CR=1 FL=1
MLAIPNTLNYILWYIPPRGRTPQVTASIIFAAHGVSIPGRDSQTFSITRYNDTKNTNTGTQWRIHPCQHNNRPFSPQCPGRNHCPTSPGRESPALSCHGRQKGSGKALLTMPFPQWLSTPARCPPSKISLPFLS